MSRSCGGQSLVEYLLCVAMLCAALWLPVVDGHSAAALLVLRLAEFFEGFGALLALA